MNDWMFWGKVVGLNIFPIIPMLVSYFVNFYNKEDTKKMRIGNAMLFSSIGISFLSSFVFTGIFNKFYDTGEEFYLEITKVIYLVSGILSSFFGIFNGLVSAFVSPSVNKGR